jgi:zinc protease
MIAALLTVALCATPPDLSHAPTLPVAPAWEVPIPAEGNAGAIRVLVLNVRALPLVHADVVVRAGSEDDPTTAFGLAAMTATFLKEGGGGTRSGPEIDQAFAQIGSELEVLPEVDAAHFTFTVLSANLASALGMAADVIARPRLTPAEFPVSLGKRLAEVQSLRDEPREIANDVFERALYGAHPYGHPVLGTPTTVPGLSLDAVKGFYGQHYGPPAVTVILVGQITLSEAVDAVGHAFANWQSTAQAPADVPVPTRGPARFVAVDRPGAPQTQIRAGRIGIDYASADLPAMEVLQTVLGGSFTSRLNQNLREKHGYTYGAFARLYPRQVAGPFTVTTGVRTDVTRESIQEIQSELTNIRGTVLPEELAKGQTLLQMHWVDAFSDGARGAQLMGMLVASRAPLDTLRKTLAQVRGLGLPDLQPASQRLFPADQTTWVVVGDRKAIEPGLGQLKGLPKIEWVTPP